MQKKRKSQLRALNLAHLADGVESRAGSATLREAGVKVHPGTGGGNKAIKHSDPQRIARHMHADKTGRHPGGKGLSAALAGRG